MSAKPSSLLSFCLCLLFLQGCAYVNPYIENLNFISIEQEKELGKKMETEISSQMKLVPDAGLNQKIKTIGNTLAAKLPRRDFDYRFYVVEDNSPNAFTIPGGAIYVHTGLIKLASNDSEIAGVMAHEIAHAFERHPAKGLSRTLGVQYLTQMLFKGNESKIQSLVLSLAQNGVLTKYGRDDEREADTVGYYLMRQSPYRPEGLMDFFLKLQKLEGGKSPFPLLSSHPPTAERIQNLQALNTQSTAEIAVQIKRLN